MAYIQVVPFNQAQGGTTPNLCLDNVRRGYGIPNKYASAWEAWQHTQQHPDRNIPAGLAVPLYYSYTATIDGVTANYGHINVQLPNGMVWSDGNIYTSIDAYLANHSPKFVGWGESINDVTIIQGEPMSTWNNGDTYNLLNLSVSTEVANKAKDAGYEGYFGAQNGEEFKKAFYEIISSLQYGQMVQAAQAGAPNSIVLAPGQYKVEG